MCELYLYEHIFILVMHFSVNFLVNLVCAICLFFFCVLMLDWWVLTYFIYVSFMSTYLHWGCSFLCIRYVCLSFVFVSSCLTNRCLYIIFVYICVHIYVSMMLPSVDSSLKMVSLLCLFCYTYMHKYTQMYICMYIILFVYIWIYIYMYIHMIIYIFSYVYMYFYLHVYELIVLSAFRRTLSAAVRWNIKEYFHSIM